MVERNDVDFMRNLEDRYKAVSGLSNRSQYKIYFCAVRPAEILFLGMNPGGDPADIVPDGTKTTSGKKVSSSNSYYENGENDIFDTDWVMHKNTRPLLRNFTREQDAEIRRRVVRTNVVFRRSRRHHDIDMDDARKEAAPFLAEIINYVAPKLIILSGAGLSDFSDLICDGFKEIEIRQREPRTNHIVFWPARVQIKGGSTDAIAVQIAHASQFSWTYNQFDVANRIRALTV